MSCIVLEDEQYVVRTEYPIHLAVSSFVDPVAKLEYVVGVNTDFYVKNSLGRSVLSLACGNSTHALEVAKCILTICPDYDVNITDDSDQCTALHRACTGQGTLPLVKLLLEHGADINCIQKDGMTPLILASWNAEGYDIVKYLLQHPKLSNVNQHAYNNVNGLTALMIACNVKNSEIIKLLLADNRVNINEASTTGGETPLMRVCDKDDLNLIKILCDHPNINLNQSDNVGQTALLNSVAKIEVLQELLRHPSLDINKPNSNADSILSVACMKDLVETVSFLLNFQQININSANKQHETPLHIMATKYYSDSEILHLLLNHPNIDVNYRNWKGDSPLHFACKIRNVEFIKVILEHPKIDINTTNNMGNTPIMIAASDPNGFAIVKLLLGNPIIDLGIINKQKQDVFSLALQHKSISQLLQSRK